MSEKKSEERRGFRDNAWEEYQFKVIFEWLQKIRDKDGNLYTITKDLSRCMSDGTIILHIVEMLYLEQTHSPLEEASKSQTKKKNFDKHSPFYKMHSRENILIAFHGLEKLGLNLGTISVDDIASGSLKMLLALLWKMYRYAEDNDLMRIFEKREEPPPLPTTLPEALASTSGPPTPSVNNNVVLDVPVPLSKRASVNSGISEEDEFSGQEKEGRVSEDNEDEPKRISRRSSLSNSWSRPTRNRARSVHDVFQGEALSTILEKGEPSSASSSPKPMQVEEDKKSSRRSKRLSRTIDIKHVFSGENSLNKGSTPTTSNNNLLDNQEKKDKKEKAPEKKEQSRHLVANEILTTEEHYGKNLDDLVNIYLEKLKAVCSENELKNIFSNCQNIRNFSISLQKELCEIMKNWNSGNLTDQAVGKTFLKFYPFFKMYIIYCNNYETSVETIRNCLKRKEFETICEAEKKNTGGLDLDSLLITPVQRIPRYMLLLKELLKHTSPTHPDYSELQQALDKMMEIANIVNDSMKTHQTAKAYDFLVESIKGIKPYMAVHRKFVSEAQYSIALIDKSAPEIKFVPMWLVLFNDMLFLATGQNQKNRKLKDAKNLQEVWIRSIEGNDLVGNSIEVKSPEENIYFIRFEKKDEKNILFEHLLNLLKEKTKLNDPLTTSRVFRYEFHNGNTYEGEWMDAKMNGNGIMTLANKNVYEGDFKSDQIEGKGIMKYFNGDTLEGEWKGGIPNGKGKIITKFYEYEGEFLNGKMTGEGTIKWCTGDQYHGTLKDGLLDGNGILTCRDGTRYQGDWSKNMRHGKGVLYYKDNGYYEGEFVENRRHGKGKRTYLNGDYYLGDFDNDEKHGEGTLVSDGNKCKYQGQWFRNKRHGKGKLTRTKKDTDYLVYDGEWMNDERHGGGSLTLNDATYTGNWQFGFRDGHGKFTDGELQYTGQWKNDVPHGPGIRVSHGVKYQGEWDQGKPKGVGVSTMNVGGKIVTETYKDGRIDAPNPSFSFANLPDSINRWVAL